MPRGPPLPPKARTGANAAPSLGAADDPTRQHAGRAGGIQNQQQQQQQQQQLNLQRDSDGKDAEEGKSLRSLFRLLERRGIPSGQVRPLESL